MPPFELWNHNFPVGWKDVYGRLSHAHAYIRYFTSSPSIDNQLYYQQLGEQLTVRTSQVFLLSLKVSHVRHNALRVTLHAGSTYCGLGYELPPVFSKMAGVHIGFSTSTPPPSPSLSLFLPSSTILIPAGNQNCLVLEGVRGMWPACRDESSMYCRCTQWEIKG